MSDRFNELIKDTIKATELAKQLTWQSRLLVFQSRVNRLLRQSDAAIRRSQKKLETPSL